MFDSSRYTEFDYAPRDQAITEAQLCFDRILLVDDVIWIECAEPYLLKLMYDSKISYDLATLRHATRPNHRSHSWMLHADIQRADDPAAASDIEILIPESIQRQPERDTIIDAAMFLIEDYSYTYLSGVHPRVFSALGEVHSLYYGRPREEIDCDALVEPIQRLTYAMEHFETEERLANSGKISGYRNAVERWLDRRLSAVDILPAPGTASRL
jgi:hypothetical protein